MHAKVFSIQIFASNSAEGLHFSAFHYNRDFLLKMLHSEATVSFAATNYS